MTEAKDCVLRLGPRQVTDRLGARSQRLSSDTCRAVPEAPFTVLYPVAPVLLEHLERLKTTKARGRRNCFEIWTIFLEFYGGAFHVTVLLGRGFVSRPHLGPHFLLVDLWDADGEETTKKGRAFGGRLMIKRQEPALLLRLFLFPYSCYAHTNHSPAWRNQAQRLESIESKWTVELGHLMGAHVLACVPYKKGVCIEFRPAVARHVRREADVDGWNENRGKYGFAPCLCFTCVSVTGQCFYISLESLPTDIHAVYGRRGMAILSAGKASDVPLLSCQLVSSTPY